MIVLEMLDPLVFRAVKRAKFMKDIGSGLQDGWYLEETALDAGKRVEVVVA